VLSPLGLSGPLLEHPLKPPHSRGLVAPGHVPAVVIDSSSSCGTLTPLTRHSWLRLWSFESASVCRRRTRCIGTPKIAPGLFGPALRARRLQQVARPRYAYVRPCSRRARPLVGASCRISLHIARPVPDRNRSSALEGAHAQSEALSPTIRSVESMVSS
jgi:hypothetical protein